jgi:transcriptional repressor NrdR
VMERLKQIDPVAYVRFASVYRRFDDIGEFRDVIENLQPEAERPAGDEKGPAGPTTS